MDSRLGPRGAHHLLGPAWSRPLASPTASPGHDPMVATLKTEDLRASGPAISSPYHCRGAEQGNTSHPK